MEDTETISLAIQALKNGVKKLHQRASKKREIDVRWKKRADRLVRHIEHLLRKLATKRQCLEALIQWFSQDEWSRLESKLSDRAHTQAILEHAMTLLIRCQDGLVLLTSGECRHPVDIQEAKNTTFPSRLTTLEQRSDGYTKLYSGATYSGFGWDEYANETVGLQVRLAQSLKQCHKDPWRYLEEQEFTQLLETVLDQHEIVVKRLQQDLQALKRRMTADITKRLAKPTQFTTQDKMERLEVPLPHLGPHQKISVARRADNFQIVGTSVLPDHLTRRQDWKREVALTLTVTPSAPAPVESKNQKRSRKRLAIVESDSEEDSDDKSSRRPEPSKVPRRQDASSISAQNQSKGLMVQVKSSDPGSLQVGDSLATIKTQMGVDVKGLEHAREVLELEDEATNGKRTISDHFSFVSNEARRVQQLTSVLRRAEGRNAVERDDNEIWDARECLRQAYMELGNHLLWDNSPNPPTSPNNQLESALDSFEEAVKLVLLQQKAHQTFIERTNDQTEESRTIHRDLQFLLGQAIVNIGITLVELSKDYQGTSQRKRLSRGIQKLQQVRSLVADIKEETTPTLVGSQFYESRERLSIQQYRLEVEKLDVMACRWMGTAHWSMGTTESRKAAVDLFQEGWGVFRGIQQLSNCARPLLHYHLEIATEAIYSTSMLADLAYSSLQQSNRKLREADGVTYMQLIKRALMKQQEIEKMLEQCMGSNNVETMVSRLVRDYKDEHEVGSSADTELYLEGIEEWWKTCLEQSKELERLKSSRSKPQPRKTLVLDPVSKAPPARYILTDGIRRKKAPKQKERSPTFSSRRADEISSAGEEGNDAFYAIDDTPVFRRPAQFRKWGDDLLPTPPQSPGGESGTRGDKLACPSIAPKVPEAFREIFERQQQQQRLGASRQ